MAPEATLPLAVASLPLAPSLVTSCPSARLAAAAAALSASFSHWAAIPASEASATPCHLGTYTAVSPQSVCVLSAVRPHVAMAARS